MAAGTRKPGKLDPFLSPLDPRRRRTHLLLLSVAVLYLLLIYQLPLVLDDVYSPSSSHVAASGFGSSSSSSAAAIYSELPNVPNRPRKILVKRSTSPLLAPSPPVKRRALFVSGLFSHDIDPRRYGGPTAESWRAGKQLFLSLREGNLTAATEKRAEESCPDSIVASGSEFARRKGLLFLPCGLTLGSHVTVVARPMSAHAEHDSKISWAREGGEGVLVSQFMMELQGIKTVDGEDPPRILHFNPRLKGDWSSRPVVEHNSCYRMQWGPAQRCEGWRSRADEETVDGLVKCERWIRGNESDSEESKILWWLNRLIGRNKKVPVEWPFPFAEGKLFVLTLNAGFEGYHVNVDGRHITSFPYRTGFVLEDATGFSLKGDLEVTSIVAGSLPTTHPAFSPQKYLDMSSEWQAPPTPEGPVELCIGILSAGNHFAERMAVRKSWMQSVAKSSNMVARFFVAMHARNEVDVELKKEAEFFGDIVLVPYMDSYDLVVLKTIAICEYGVRAVSAKYIMKCDDDTFIRVGSVMEEIKKVPVGRSLYIGNMNYYHKPLRTGKWAVSYEEWPGENYPTYANGPGYIISTDIAKFVISEFERHTLRLFKMEDVSMGMWVEQFNSSRRVEYVHDLKFCQFGCVAGYFTAHYQSPRQMICMWEKLQSGKPGCCDMR